MRKEIEATVSGMKQARIEFNGVFDRLMIELIALKIAMERYHPGTSRSFPKFRQEAAARHRKPGAT
jgi:hypothetical protein